MIILRKILVYLYAFLYIYTLLIKTNIKWDLITNIKQSGKDK